MRDFPFFNRFISKTLEMTDAFMKNISTHELAHKCRQ